MKQIGIIVAMQEELEAVEGIMKDCHKIQIFELSFIVGKIQARKCILVKCGVGKVNAARTTQILLDNFEIEYVINLGAAGALNPMLKIGDIVIGEKLVQHDFDITAFGHSKGYITGVGNQIESNHLLMREFELAIKKIQIPYQIKKGIIASGDIFCTDVNMKNEILAIFDAECVEMEGAAVAQVCYLSNVPFIVIRSISDSPDGNNEITFDEYLKLAAQRCAEILGEVFKK